MLGGRGDRGLPLGSDEDQLGRRRVRVTARLEAADAIAPPLAHLRDRGFGTGGVS